MIDFVSTRLGTAPDIQRYAHFLAGAVAQFVRDASAPINPEETRARKNHGAAREAIEYLFRGGSKVELHLEMLGSGAALMRAALLSDRALDNKHGFTEATRRVIQARHALWVAENERVAATRSAQAALAAVTARKANTPQGEHA